MGVIIPEIVHHFFTTVISGIEKVANERGYNVIIGLSNESFTTEVINMEMLANGSIDGFILSVSRETEYLKDYHHLTESIDQGMPIVLFDRAISEVECDKVVVDDVEGSRKAVKKLISLGCKNIGILTTKDYVSVGRLRTNGYKIAISEANLPLNEDLILKLNDEVNDEAHMDLLLKEVRNLLINNPEIDGIFAVNEIYALSAMKEAQKLGKRIPEDIKFIGFTDGVLSKFASPSLTSVSQHGKQLGERAAQLLIDRLENDHMEPPFQTVVIETELIERESTS